MVQMVPYPHMKRNKSGRVAAPPCDTAIRHNALRTERRLLLKATRTHPTPTPYNH